MNCPNCESIQINDLDCYVCQASGEDMDGDECHICDGTGHIDGSYECSNCAEEFTP